MTSRRLIVFAALLPWAAHAAVASADSAMSVALLSPPEDLVIAESATRLAAELTTAGFMVVKAACIADDDQCSPAIKTAGSTAGSKNAEIKLWRAKGAATILVSYWRDPDTATQKRFTVTSGDETRSASFLAIQAYDLFQLAAGHDIVKRPMPTAGDGGEVGPHQPRFALELGGAVIPSLGDGLGVAGGPAAHAWLLRPRNFAVALALAGPAYSRRLTSAQGSASLRQESASLLVCYRPFPEGRVQPSLCGGGGIYHAAIEGRATNPAARNLSPSHWTPFADVGLGTFVRLDSHYILGLQARTWWLRRYPQILIGGDTVGETGNPALLLVASIGRLF